MAIKENNKINILYLTPSLTWGGLEKVIFQVVQGLDKEKFKVTIVYWKPLNFYEQQLKNIVGVEVIRINSKIWSLRYFLRLIKILKSKNFDIIHSWFYDEDLVSVLLNKLILRKKSLLVAGFHAPFFNKRTHFIRYKIIGKYFHKIVCCSKWFRQLVIKGCGLDEKKVITIYNGIDVDNIPLQVSLKEIMALKKSFGFSVEDKILLCVARLSKEKGIDILLRAMSIVIKEMCKVKLLIIGDGPEKNNLLHLVEFLNIGKYIFFAGFKENLFIYYHLSDIFVLPSVEEPFGIVLLEAMIAKKPICATTVGGIPEIVISGKSGILVRPNSPESLAEGIISLLRLPRDELKKFGEEGFKIVKTNFSVEKMRKLYNDLYESLISRDR